jgi:hypothetical protein
LAAGEFKLVDEVVQHAERVELGFLVLRSDGGGVPPVGVALDRGADKRAWQRAGLGEAYDLGELVEQPQQGFDRLSGVGGRGLGGVSGRERLFEQGALVGATSGEIKPALAAGCLDTNQRGCAALVGLCEVVLDEFGLALPPARGAGDELTGVDCVFERGGNEVVLERLLRRSTTPSGCTPRSTTCRRSTTRK